MKIIGGLFRHRKIVAPKGGATRPTSERLRESIFNICQNYIENSNFLDLYAGSGAMGIEALSRGAKSATFVDDNRESIRAIKENLKNFDIERQAHIFQGHAFDFIERKSSKERSFDIIFADPPYYSNVFVDLIKKIDNSEILAAEGVFFIEAARGAEKDLIELQTLKLVSSRHMGRSALLQFQRCEGER